MCKVKNYKAQKIISSNLRFDICNRKLRTPNEGIDQRYLKIWADVANKICFGRG